MILWLDIELTRERLSQMLIQIIVNGCREQLVQFGGILQNGFQKYGYFLLCERLDSFGSGGCVLVEVAGFERDDRKTGLSLWVSFVS